MTVKQIEAKLTQATAKRDRLKAELAETSKTLAALKAELKAAKGGANKEPATAGA